MVRMGFERQWIDLIMKCVTTVSSALSINGRIGEVFCPSRGLRQADSLSPFLFLICSYGLSTLMRHAQKDRLLKGTKASRRGLVILHLLFVDDCILLNTSEDDKELISRRVGYSNYLEKYLGLPNMVGRNKKASFQNLKDRMKKKIDGWSIRFLSEGGKEVFIKSVRQAMPTYFMACFLLPKSLCSGFDSIIAKFRWQKGPGRREIHWCDWKKMCAFKEEGGKGFWNLEKFNIALLAKQGWRLITNPDSLLAHVLKAKYFPTFHFLNASLGTTPSYAARILQIPLATERHADLVVWRGEPSGEFSVRSAYKLLYRGCPRCNRDIETMDHAFRICFVSVEVWSLLGMQWILQKPDFDSFTWLIWVFEESSLYQRRLFCCALWALWTDGNERLYEGKTQSAREISRFISSYLKEMDDLEGSGLTRNVDITTWVPPSGTTIKINFDRAFDKQRSQLASEVVARNGKGRLMIARLKLHENVGSTFAAEALACLCAIQTGIEMGLETIIEGDALSIVKKCQNNVMDKSEITAYIRNIDLIAEHFLWIHFRHIKKEANHFAHTIATENQSRGEQEYLNGTVPGFALRRMEEEWLRELD
ncbi:hypothetical protein CXB51_034919 [Gossypium anomalum]|uniref:RNase H type-1 domain-containing protein n=1 Tax=Gossypium anomalum TaxID=47600 RepID=A0A8J6CK04_9ROSI|nr:hypothetical protein CXB51_034919 [Gossypium anomalum]